MITRFIWVLIFFDKALRYGDSAKFCGYVEINTEQLCVELCNFVQCYIFVNYLTYYNAREVSGLFTSRTSCFVSGRSPEERFIPVLGYLMHQ
jgi:hypothetical protein